MSVWTYSCILREGLSPSRDLTSFSHRLSIRVSCFSVSRMSSSDTMLFITLSTSTERRERQLSITMTPFIIIQDSFIPATFRRKQKNKHKWGSRRKQKGGGPGKNKKDRMGREMERKTAEVETADELREQDKEGEGLTDRKRRVREDSLQFMCVLTSCRQVYL